MTVMIRPQPWRISRRRSRIESKSSVKFTAIWPPAGGRNLCCNDAARHSLGPPSATLREPGLNSGRDRGEILL